MTLTELKATKEALKRQLQEYENISPSCTNCLQFTGNVCQQFQASPPSEWVAGPVDCEHWKYDGIPF